MGISVDNAVDIAKESAQVILLKKDLMVLEPGLIEGRKVYANLIKYIKMTASSNFGNVFSVLVASALLPFLPMAAIHLLLLNLVYDITCLTIPWDNVDEDYLMQPRLAAGADRRPAGLPADDLAALYRHRPGHRDGTAAAALLPLAGGHPAAVYAVGHRGQATLHQKIRRAVVNQPAALSIQ